MPRITVKLNWYDFWIGFYWNADKRSLYICPVPTLVIEINFWEIYVKKQRKILLGFLEQLNREAENLGQTEADNDK